MPEDIHTYSIVARDANSDQLGVAVQSHTLAVGRVVAWAEPGVGAVATQAVADPSFGPLGLALMRSGKSAGQSLATLLETDAAPELRQVAMIDARGGVIAHTGHKCIAAAGHQVGPNYSVQANMMLRDTVWPEMGAVFEAAQGDLAERMLVALEAAQMAGGDMRGMQSAALLVVAGPASDRPWDGRVFDLRVDDHASPLSELRRLLSVARAGQHVRKAMELLGGPNPNAREVEQARAEFAMVDQYAEVLRGNLELAFWYAVGLAGAGLVDESLPVFQEVFASDACWRELVQRLPDSGRLPDNPVTLARILKM